MRHIPKYLGDYPPDFFFVREYYSLNVSGLNQVFQLP